MYGFYFVLVYNIMLNSVSFICRHYLSNKEKRFHQAALLSTHSETKAGASIRRLPG